MPVILRWFLRLSVANPITVRLVQGGSRRRRHFYMRAGYLAVLILALMWALVTLVEGSSVSMRELASSGAAAFTVIAYLQVGLICIIAPVFMAGAIAQEANPRTWDIMLTTPLSATEIVLGNLFGRLFFILALLFSSLPLFAVTQYFGGVPGKSIFGSYLVAASAALLVGSIAIALSVSRLAGKRAVFTFYIAVVTYLAVTFAADRITAGGARVTYMTGLNPFLALEALLSPTGYRRLPDSPNLGFAERAFLVNPVATWMAISVGLSLTLMVVSAITVRLGGIAGLGGQTGRTSGVPWYRKMFGLSAAGAEHRAPRAVWNSPIAWREAAARNATLGRMAARWSFIAFGALLGLALVLIFHFSAMNAPLFRQVVVYTVLGELGVVTLVAINMAATSVAREREDGTLDLLLTTPLTPGDYLSGKLRGMMAYLLPMIAVPVGTVGLAGLYVLAVQAGLLQNDRGATVPFTVVGTIGGGGGPPPAIPVPAVLPEAFLTTALVTLPFIAFCVMVGMQWSLKSKGTIGAVVTTFAIVAAVAGAVGLCAFQAGRELPVLGPAIAALSPASVLYANVYPAEAMQETVSQAPGAAAGAAGALLGARLALFVGAAVAAGVYFAIVYAMLSNMKRTFDMTVRKLAGMK